MGKRGWLDHLIQQSYCPAIAQLNDSPEGRQAAQELALSIREGWAERGAVTLEQQQSLMDQTRRAIKDRFGSDHFSLDFIAFSREEHFELNHLKQQKARKRQLHQQYIKDPDAIVATAVRALDSPEWAEVAAALAVLTGRRLGEVLKTAEFSIKSQWVVSFSGALKRRGEEVPLVFDIPTLTTAKRVVEATQRLRAITPQDANEVRVAIASDRLFSHLLPAPVDKANLYTHLWRSVFCCIATFWYCPKHVDDLLFKAHIMGHFEALTVQEQGDGATLRQRLETFSSERHYRRYEIDDSLIAYHKGKRKGIKLGVAGIQPLDTFVDGLPELQPPPRPRKHRSTLRVWKEDHDALAAVLQHFEGNNQPEKVANWILWSQHQLNHQSGNAIAPPETEPEIIDGPPLPDDPVQPSEQPPESLAIAPVEEDAPPAQAEGGMEEAIASPAATPLERKLDQLIDVMALFVQSQLQPAQPPIPEPPQAVQPSPVSPTEQPETAQQVTPRKYKTGEADAIINRAIDAIIEHNNQPGLLHDDKWAITINGLKNFSPNQRVIQRILELRKSEVEQHHQLHQLHPRHNDRHKRKYKITDIIHIG